MAKLAADSSTPLYLQLEEAIRDEIEKGVYQYGERIPSEIELGKNYGVSRITVRNAVTSLCKSGLLIKRPGKGTFVSLPVITDSYTSGGSFTLSCRQIGVIPSTKVVEKKEGVTMEDLEGKLIQIDRVRFIDKIPAIYEIDYFLEQHKFLLNADVENTPIMDTITANTGLLIGGFKNTFEVAFANKQIAKYLNCPKGTALLLVSQQVLSTNDEVIYYNHQYVRSDIYKFRIKNERTLHE